MNAQHSAGVSEADAELAINNIAEQIGNIEAAIFVMDEGLTSTQQGNLHFLMFQQIFRMCLSWLVLTAVKIEELWRKYGTIATPYTRERMRAAIKEISNRGMTDLRNKSVAHILDRNTGKPTTPAQIEEAFKMMTRGNPLAFIHWLRHPDDPKAETLSRALRLFRADIMKGFPKASVTMPVSTYGTPSGDVEF